MHVEPDCITVHRSRLSDQHVTLPAYAAELADRKLPSLQLLREMSNRR